MQTSSFLDFCSHAVVLCVVWFVDFSVGQVCFSHDEWTDSRGIDAYVVVDRHGVPVVGSGEPAVQRFSFDY